MPASLVLFLIGSLGFWFYIPIKHGFGGCHPQYYRPEWWWDSVTCWLMSGGSNYQLVVVTLGSMLTWAALCFAWLWLLDLKDDLVRRHQIQKWKK